MLRKAGGAGLMGLYAVVVLWTLVKTSTGMIHAVLCRLDAHRKEKNVNH